jgi:hypothetical protein
MIPRATAFRSTWVVSSHESLRAGGHWELYLRALGEGRDAILSCVAGTWLPMAVARAHYRACDALGLSSQELIATRRGPGDHVRRVWFASFIAAAERAGACPWATLSQLDRMWQRAADGGAVAVFRLGATQARIEYVGCELFDIPYFRLAARAVLLMLAEHFGESPVVHVEPRIGSGEARLRAGVGLSRVATAGKRPGGVAARQAPNVAQARALPRREPFTAIPSLSARCCPFFTFVVERELADGALWFRITGPDGTKLLLNDAFAEAVSTTAHRSQ